jgi:hypothetical protein
MTPQKGLLMFTSEQYRAKATEYGDLLKTAAGPNERREFQQLEQSFITLADNEQWLADNYAKTVHAPGHGRAGGAALVEEDDHILRCLGAAVIMQWNTLPTKLRKELFDNAGSMEDVLETTALRGQIARFLHKHKDGATEHTA